MLLDYSSFDDTMTSPPHTGTLYLVPAPLDFGCSTNAPLQDVMPLGTLRTAARIEHWICESARTTRAYLKRIHEVVPLRLPLQQITLTELPRHVHKKGDHAGSFDASSLLAPAALGHDIGLTSEAGMPAVADPGSSVVRAAHDLNMTVVPLTGPVSLLLALATSGLNGQSFSFAGYLPQDAAERDKSIHEFELLALKTGQTQIFIETPYRNQTLLQALVRTLQPHTRLAVCSGLTLPSASNRSQLVRQWRTQSITQDNSTPAIFMIGR